MGLRPVRREAGAYHQLDADESDDVEDRGTRQPGRELPGAARRPQAPRFTSRRARGPQRVAPVEDAVELHGRSRLLRERSRIAFCLDASGGIAHFGAERGDVLRQREVPLGPDRASAATSRWSASAPIAARKRVPFVAQAVMTVIDAT